MAQPTPQLSPDGAFWWDGQAWRPVATQPPPAPIPALPSDAAARPSWLPAGTELRDRVPEAPIVPTSGAADESYAPEYAEPQSAAAWMAPQTQPTNRNTIVLVAAAALVLLIGGIGVFAVTPAMSRSSTDTSSNAVTATPKTG